MNSTVGYIVESTIAAIVLAWVITHAGAFNTITGATSGAVVTSVHALWGPQGN